MEFLVISYALFGFILLVAILAPFGKKKDHKNERISRIKKDSSYTNADGMMNQSFYARMIEPTVKKVNDFIESKTPKSKNGDNENKYAQLEKKLRLAGMFIDASEFNFKKMIFMIAMIVATLILVGVLKLKAEFSLLIILVSLALTVLAPTYYLKSRVSNHQLGIKRQLPDVMDMLSVCIEAGLSFDAALLKVSEKMSGPFIDELLIVHREIQMGRTRRDALKTLSDSTSVEELRTFLSALIQAEQLGIPINNIMQTQSEQLRLTRKMEAKEKGMKSTIKMLVPMLIFIFPVVFIIILGPTVLNIIENFINK